MRALSTEHNTTLMRNTMKKASHPSKMAKTIQNEDNKLLKNTKIPNYSLKKNTKNVEDLGQTSESEFRMPAGHVEEEPQSSWSAGRRDDPYSYVQEIVPPRPWYLSSAEWWTIGRTG